MYMKGLWGSKMNKQQLAAKIWESANQMRSKIEANEYKDYILGFFFISIFQTKKSRTCIIEDMMRTISRNMLMKKQMTVIQVCQV